MCKDFHFHALFCCSNTIYKKKDLCVLNWNWTPQSAAVLCSSFFATEPNRLACDTVEATPCFCHATSVSLFIPSLKTFLFWKPFLQSHCPECVCVCVFACVCVCVFACVCACVCVLQASIWIFVVNPSPFHHTKPRKIIFIILTRLTNTFWRH